MCFMCGCRCCCFRKIISFLLGFCKAFCGILGVVFLLMVFCSFFHLGTYKICDKLAEFFENITDYKSNTSTSETTITDNRRVFKRHNGGDDVYFVKKMKDFIVRVYPNQTNYGY